MKRIKKIASLVLAMSMVLAMSVTVLAADNNSHNISIKQNANDKLEHTYAAYQIFAGDLAPNADYRDSVICGKKEHTHTDACKEGETLTCVNEEHVHTADCYQKYNAEYVLSNIVWGSGVINTDNLLEELKADKDDVFSGAFKNCETAADVAKALSEFSNTNISESGALDYFSKIVSKYLSDTSYTATGVGDVTITVSGSGYYLVADETENLAGNNEEGSGAYTRFLLEVVGDSVMVVKSEVPSGDKEIYVDADNTDDANNASIGSHVSYKITSNVPNWAGYDYYYFIMNDTLSEGLTFDRLYNSETGEQIEDSNTISVMVGGVELTQGQDYYVYEGTDAAPYTFRLAFDNIMNYTVGADIVVTYSATVNDKAIVGTTGNDNTWNLQYSNNPNETYKGTEDDRKPGLPADESTTVLGQTPDEKTLTYVTELEIVKYANEVLKENLLAGAEFTLTGTSYQVVLSDVDYFRAPNPEENEVGEWYLLTDGTYTKEAPTGTDYVEIGVGTKETTEGYILKDGKYIVPENKADYDGETLYKLVRGTNEKYVDVNTKYVKDSKKTTIYEPVDISMELTTGEDGTIAFTGLGAGEYTLKETVTPAGFNTLDDIHFEIKFKAPEEEVTTGDETCTWTIESKTSGFEIREGWGAAAGRFAADIVNKSGSLLPSTGGIGTTIFYVVGGLLVAGAGILLVTKKRMSAHR